MSRSFSTSTGKLAAVTLGLPALLARVKGPLLPLVLRNARSHPGLVERGRARWGATLAWAITRKLGRFATEDIDPAIVNFVTSMIAATRIEVIADSTRRSCSTTSSPRWTLSPVLGC